VTQMFAYCGLDCATCPAYIATQADDQAAKEKIVAEWRIQFNAPEMPVEAATCDGCTASGRHGGYCGTCAVRACGAKRGVVTCAHCPDYGCEKLEAFLLMAPPARENLEAIRRSL
jgi:hypothetical protein